MQYKEILLNDLDNKQLQDLAGVNDSNIKLIASLFDIDITKDGYGSDDTSKILTSSIFSYIISIQK